VYVNGKMMIVETTPGMRGEKMMEGLNSIFDML
jgi:hypothetical protein